MKLINKQVVNLPTNMCHYIIQERNKFLIDYNIPRLTNTDIIPSSHLPINFIKPIENIIFKIIKTNIFPTIEDEYKEKIDNFEINTVFFVENSYEYNRKYINIKNIDYLKFFEMNIFFEYFKLIDICITCFVLIFGLKDLNISHTL